MKHGELILKLFFASVIFTSWKACEKFQLFQFQKTGKKYLN